jgi:hypothetical protein
LTTAARAPISTSFFHRRYILDLEAGQHFGLGEVRRDDGNALDHLLAEELHAGGIEQLRPAARWVDDRIENHAGEAGLVEKLGDGDGIATIGEHADLHIRDLEILGERVELGAEGGVSDRLHRLDALRRLDGERGDGRHSIAVVHGKGLQVGGDAGAARWIEPRDRQDDRWCWRTVHRLLASA